MIWVVYVAQLAERELARSAALFMNSFMWPKRFMDLTIENSARQSVTQFFQGNKRDDLWSPFFFLYQIDHSLVEKNIIEIHVIFHQED